MKLLRKNNFFDRTVSLSIVYKISQMALGLVTIFVIVANVDQETQGYYYTFVSLLAIQSIFDAGLTQALFTSVSHAYGNLAKDGANYIGSSVARVKLIEAFSLCVKWNLLTGFLFLALASTYGMYILYSSHAPASVLIAWILLVSAASIQMPINAILSLIEGTNDVYSVTRIRLIQAYLQSLAIIIGFTLGLGIYSIVIGFYFGVLPGLFSFFNSHKNLLSQFIYWRPKVSMRKVWAKHYLKLQSRLAISWCSGYVITNLSVPLLLKYQGPSEAGRYGMSAQILAAFFSLASTWTNIKASEFGSLAGKNKVDEMYQIFKQTFRLSTTVMSLGLLAIFIAIGIFFQLKVPFTERVLPFWCFGLLSIGFFGNALTSLFAVYVRSFKIEPFTSLSIAHAFTTLIIAFVLIPNYGPVGAVLSVLLPAVFVNLTGGYMIYKKFITSNIK